MTGFGLPPAERNDPKPPERGVCVDPPNAVDAKEMSREEELSEFAFLLEASLLSSPIAEASAPSATVAARLGERAPESVPAAAEGTRPFDNGRKQPSTKTKYNETDTVAPDAKSMRRVGTARVRRTGRAEKTVIGLSRDWTLRTTALVLLSAGLIGVMVLFPGGALSLFRESLFIADAGTSLIAETQRTIGKYSRQTYGQAEIYKSRLLDTVGAVTGTNPLTSMLRGKSRVRSASNEAVETPPELSGAGSLPITIGAQSAQFDAALKSVNLRAESALAVAPQPAVRAPATASATQSPVGTEDGALSILSSPIAVPPPDHSPDLKTSPQPYDAAIAPVSPAVDTADTNEGSYAGEAPKPAIERARKPTQSGVGTALSTKPAADAAKRHSSARHAAAVHHAPEETTSRPMPSL
jgi:hypothetical protein